MRERFRDFSDSNLPFLGFMGLAPLATIFSLYIHRSNQRCYSSLIASDPNFIIDVAPEERWSYELFEAAGEAKFRQVVADVKAMAASLGNCKHFLFLFLLRTLISKF